MVNLSPESEVNLIDQLLKDQSKLQTPVEQFSKEHDRSPDLEGHYRNLIPLSKPGKGEQYAFEVALDRCTSCKACVAACHSQNGLDEDESWRDVGLILGGLDQPGYQQTVTTACHHCEDPECLNGCPVQAYEKSDETGVVKHLDDQCIGCSYCIFKCPFDVPKYSKKRGIVRKCDMCHERLAEGEAPACVQACPTEAIRIVTVDREEKSDLGKAGKDFLRGAPSPKITRPTTRYVGRDVPASAHAADHDDLTPEHAHWPLVAMLTLTQAGLGLVVGGALVQFPFYLVGLLLFNVGMVAATLHLGQPLKAWRFFLGLRTSWLSREILAFSIVAPLLAFPLLQVLPLPDWLTFLQSGELLEGAVLMTAFLGAIAIFTSVKIYQTTNRVLWKSAITFPRFYGTALCFGLLAGGFPFFFSLVVLAKLALDFWQVKDPEIARERKIISGSLLPVTNARIGCVLAAAVGVWVSPWLALPFLIVAELAERTLYFKAVRPLKMPGL